MMRLSWWLVAQTKKTQVYILLNLARGEAIEWEKSFTHGKDESKEDPECLKFGELCIPQTNVTLEQHKFNTWVQQHGEAIQWYVSDLMNKASTCEFDDLKNEIIKDQLVCGIENNQLRQSLLWEGKLTFQKAIELCQISELPEQRMKAYDCTKSAWSKISMAKRQEKSTTTEWTTTTASIWS